MKQILIILFLTCSVNWSQVYMDIKNTVGATQSINIENIKKMTLGDAIDIENKDGSSQSFSIGNTKKITFNGIVGVENNNTLESTSKSFNILQNYPNPFNPSTTIEYQIPESGNVVAKIYNINGQHIRTLEKSFKTSGAYKLHWDSRNDLNQNVASGIYLFQVQYNNVFLTKKIILLR